jgi:hypothetical protein
LFAADDGTPTCWICVGLRLAELADTHGIIAPDGLERRVSKEEFVQRLRALGEPGPAPGS